MNRKKLIRIFKQVVFFNKVVFPYLAVLTFFSLSIETYTYIGFLRKNIFLDSRILLYISLLSGLLTLLLRVEDRKFEPGRLIENVSSFNKLLFPVILVFFILMMAVEGRNYTNYVFSNYHIQPQNFIYVVLFSFYLLIIEQVKKQEIKHTKKKRPLSQIIKILGDNFYSIWFLTYLFALLETFTYPGILKVSVFTPIFFTLVSGFMHLKLIGSKEKVKSSFIAGLLTLGNKILIPTLIVLFIYFSALESINYPNYVFTYFHIFFSRLLILAGLSILFIVLEGERFFGVKIARFKENVLKLIVLVPLLFVAFNNLDEFIPKLVNEVGLTTRLAGASYNEKMRVRWKRFYDYVLFIKDSTSEDAVIYHPPQVKPWEFEGSQVLLRYFLYPRILISGAIDLEGYEGPAITHIVIAGKEAVKYLDDGSGILEEVIWPDERIDAKEILLMGEGNIGKKHFDPKDDRYKQKYGLITL